MINYQYHPQWNAALEASNNANAIVVELNKQLPGLSTEKLCHALSVVIEKMLSAFDGDGSLFGLFSLLSSCNKRVSPFIATRDYRIRVVSANTTGHVELEISPIYRLGPDYPERYQEQYGKKLENEAIVGLVELSHDHEHQTYLLGIDAGVAFKDSNIQHTKSMSLQLSANSNNITCALQCETQTMSKTLQWSTFNFNEHEFSSTTRKNEIAAA